MRKFMAGIGLFLLTASLAVTQPSGKDSIVNGPTHEDETISANLDPSEHIKNIGSKKDGAGMCVFSAIEMAALYQGHEEMRGWRNWCAANYAGGGYPEKVEKLLDAWWKKNGTKPIPYMQYEGTDPGPLLEIIDRTRRMACITYGYSPRYGRGFIAHMVNGVHFGPRFGTVLDNNFIGDNSYEWMTRDELVRRMRLSPGGRLGDAWIFVWLTPGAPPPPKARQ